MKTHFKATEHTVNDLVVDAFVHEVPLARTRRCRAIAVSNGRVCRLSGAPFCAKHDPHKRLGELRSSRPGESPFAPVAELLSRIRLAPSAAAPSTRRA